MYLACFCLTSLFKSEKEPSDRWLAEINAWRNTTDLEKTKQGLAIALSLPEEEGNVRDKVFSELDVLALGRDDGVDILIKFLDKIYKKDELSAAYET